MINFSFVKKKQEVKQGHPDFEVNKKFALQCLKKDRIDHPRVSVMVSDSVVFFSYSPQSHLPCGNFSTPISFHMQHEYFKQLCKDAYFTACEKAHKTDEIYNNKNN